MLETRVFLYIFKLVIEGGRLLDPAKGITLDLNNLHLRSTKLFIRVDRFTILFNIWIPDLHHCLRSLSSSSWAVGFTGVLFAYKIELSPYGFYWFDITHHRIWEKQEAVECGIIKGLNLERFLISLWTLCLKMLILHIRLIKVFQLQLVIIFIRNMASKVSFLLLSSCCFSYIFQHLLASLFIILVHFVYPCANWFLELVRVSIWFSFGAKRSHDGSEALSWWLLVQWKVHAFLLVLVVEYDHFILMLRLFRYWKIVSIIDIMLLLKLILSFMQCLLLLQSNISESWPLTSVHILRFGLAQMLLLEWTLFPLHWLLGHLSAI